MKRQRYFTRQISPAEKALFFLCPHKCRGGDRDWDNYKVGLLIAAAVTGAANLLGHGVCPSREFLGLPCPGCGMTRSILLILQGRFYDYRVCPISYTLLSRNSSASPSSIRTRFSPGFISK